MQTRRRALGITAAACCGVLVSSTSLAHIDLLSPPPRQGGSPDSNLDEGPCGQRNPGRVSERVSVFRPGETITVAWDVYVQHSSYFRLSFDLDGDDSFSQRSSAPVDPARDEPTQLLPGEGELILDYVMDRPGELEHVELSVTLPTEPCDNCTLQLTQFTYNLPLEEATYYQCADLTLEGEPVEGVAVTADPLSRPSPSAGGCSLGPAPSSTRARSLVLSVLSLGLLGLRRRGRCSRSLPGCSRPGQAGGVPRRAARRVTDVTASRGARGLARGRSSGPRTNLREPQPAP